VSLMRAFFTLIVSCGVLLAPAHAAPDPAQAAPPAQIADCARQPLRPVLQTHVVPPYPPISVRTHEEGTTILEVTIEPDGVVSDAMVFVSSGSPRLDEAAQEFVKANWRWTPPQNDCKPVSVRTRISIKWDLHDAPALPGLPTLPGLGAAAMLDTLTVKVVNVSDYPSGVSPAATPGATMLLVLLSASGQINPVVVRSSYPFLVNKAIELAKTYRWQQPRLDGKAVGGIFPLLLVWPVPGQPVPKVDDIKSVQALFAPPVVTVPIGPPPQN
jgi:TonB family protein